MDELMYGMMPRAKMENLFRAPPENRLNTPKIVPLAFSKKAPNAAVSIPGVGTCAPSL